MTLFYLIMLVPQAVLLFWVIVATIMLKWWYMEGKINISNN